MAIRWRCFGDVLAMSLSPLGSAGAAEPFELLWILLRLIPVLGFLNSEVFQLDTNGAATRVTILLDDAR